VSDIPVPDASDTRAQTRSREAAGQLARQMGDNACWQVQTVGLTAGELVPALQGADEQHPAPLEHATAAASTTTSPPRPGPSAPTRLDEPLTRWWGRW
jgi:hypothetical protein